MKVYISKAVVYLFILALTGAMGVVFTMEVVPILYLVIFVLMVLGGGVILCTEVGDNL